MRGLRNEWQGTKGQGLWLPAQADGQTFGAFATATSPDYADFPRRPYYPSRDELSRPAASAADRRPLLMVPLTACDYPRALSPWHRTDARDSLTGPRARLLLEHLPKHRIARRLRFVDPLSPEIRALAETASHR